jgi:D-3-phosphoglycerate dehydrogenase
VDAIRRYEKDLGAAGCEVVAQRTEERFEEEELLPLVTEIDGIICGDDRITERVLDAAPRLRAISKWGTGIDSIDVEAARRRGIAVCNTPGAFSEPVADTVFGYVILFARKLDRMTADMRAGLWRRLPLKALGECTLGVIGLGSCGRAVVRRANAFGMRVLGCTIMQPDYDTSADLGASIVTLDKLLSESDFVTIHADLRSDNVHLINSHNIRLMKQDSVLINTARGRLVDEEALVTALRERWIGGAALDVFQDEPLPPDSPLRTLENVHLAPHNANASPAAAECVHANSIRNVIDALSMATRQ